MKHYPVLITGGLCLLLAGLLPAASFSPVHESTYCDSDALAAADIPEPNEFTDPQDQWGSNYNEVYSSIQVEPQPGESVYAQGQSIMEFYIGPYGMDDPDNMLYFYGSAFSVAEISSPRGTEAWGWSSGATVAPGYATGNVYEIVPEPGESVGDWVTVTVEYTGHVSTHLDGGGTVSSVIDGGFAGEALLITLNCADYDNPQPDEIVHAFSRRDTDGEYCEEAAFSARVGDVIGIHAGVSTHAYTDTDAGVAESSVDIELSLHVSEGQAPPFEASMADFDGSGFVDLADLALFTSVWLQPVGDNDACANAIALTLDTPVAGSNVGATGGPMDGCSDGADGKDVWYKFTAPEDIWVDIHVAIDDPEAFDSTLSVWDGCDGSQIACEEVYGSEHIWGHYMNEGETIYIRVAGYNGPIPDEGAFTVSVTMSTE